MGEGNNKEIVKLYNSMKIYWGINSKLEKDIQNSETLGRRVAEPHEQVRSRQMSSEWARSCWIGDQYESGCKDRVKSNN